MPDGVHQLAVGQRQRAAHLGAQIGKGAVDQAGALGIGGLLVGAQRWQWRPRRGGPRHRGRQGDAADPGLSGRFDLVTILEGFHDMARPVRALRAVRAMLADGASVLMIDERVADAFAAPADDLERYHYAWSVVGCLPGAMGDPQTAATGAVMRVSTLRRYAADAGFRSVEVLPIETPAWRFYRLHP